MTKSRMVLNGEVPRLTVDPETYEVHADGKLLSCRPAEKVPLTQAYFLL